MAGITKVQAWTNATSATTSVSKSFGVNPTQGNTILAVAIANNCTGGATDITINGWSPLNSVVGVSSSNAYARFFGKIAGPGESITVTANANATTNNMAIAIAEYSWLDPNPLDQIAHTDDTGVTVLSRATGTTPTISVANELLVGAVVSGSTLTSPTWGILNAETSTTSLYVASLIVSSIAAEGDTLSWTTTARRAGGMIVTFKGLAAAKKLTALGAG